MHNLIKYIWCTAIVAIVGLVGCSKTELAPPSAAEVAFVIEWPVTKTSDLPATGSIYLYPKSGGAPVVISGIEGKSSSMVIAEGKYDFVVFNENIENIQLRNHESINDFEAFLPLKSRTDSRVANVVDQADYFYLMPATSNREIEIINGEAKVYTLRPAAATQSFRFQVVMNTNIEFKDIQGVLSGVASRLHLLSAKAVAEDISAMQVPFELSTNSDGLLVASGVIETFGVDPSNREPGSNTLILDLVPTVPNDDLKTHYEEDITTDFDKFNNVSLDIKVTVGPPTPSKPGELQITVDIVPWIIEEGGSVDVNP